MANGNWYTAFLVTPAGIILGDPINPAFATWLKGELASRFKVPVRYVGFEIPNKFVIGYGLDFAERYRNLPYVAVLHPDLIPPH